MKNAILFTISLAVLGCGPQENLDRLKSINKSLEFSNAIIRDANAFVKYELEDKTRDFRDGPYSAVWNFRAGRIKKSADSIVALIEDLKKELIKQSDSLQKEKAPLIDQLCTTNGQGYNLINKLADYKESLPAILNDNGPVINPENRPVSKAEIQQLNSVVPLLPVYSDSLSFTKRKPYTKKWLEENFFGVSSGMTLVALSKIENDLLTTTKTFMDFCLMKTSILVCGYVSFRGVAVLSSSYVKQGQPIEVTAGVGEFSGANRPRITVSGKEMKLNDDGTVVHRFAATGKPGRHNVDVKIEYITIDGSKAEVTRKLEYIIAD